MLTLLLAVGLAVLISFSCSLAEAALYAVPWAAVERLRNDGKKSGQLLFKMRTEVDKPIAAILTLNTVANTAGSTIAGAAFLAVYGSTYMALLPPASQCSSWHSGKLSPKHWEWPMRKAWPAFWPGLWPSS